MKNKKQKNKKIVAIDLVLIVTTLSILASLVTYVQPLIIAPMNNLETTDTSVLFEFERGNVILIDDNLEFSSPQEIFAEDNLVINLKPGKYYWKVKGVLDSEVRELTILSEVNLKLKQIDDKYSLVNAGNVELDVDIYDNHSLIGNVVLDVDSEENVSGTKFVGGQNE